MAYCSVSQVEGIQRIRFPGGFHDAPVSPATTPEITNPTLTDVNGFISTIASEIDEIIRVKGYQTPVIATDFVKGLNAMGAAWLVEISLNVSGNADQMKRAKDLSDAYQRGLTRIENKPRITGAIPATGQQNNLVTSDGMTGYKNINAEFKISEKNW
jgi:hypothetical protein